MTRKTADPPATVKVGPHVYAIVVERIEGDYGRTDCAGQRILVNPDQSTSNQRDTVLHELIHCALLSAGIGGYPEAPLKPDLEERVVRALSPLLLQVVRDNPELVEFLRVGE